MYPSTQTATRKEFSVRDNYLACQTHVVEKNMKIGYKSTENLRSKIHEKKAAWLMEFEK